MSHVSSIRNLDLGNVIWLNVSRKLLSFHKWFFTDLDHVPLPVREEFYHHSHTHPNTTITTGSNSHDCAYTYVFPTICGAACTGFTHSHILYGFSSSGPHTHDIVVSFGSASLGSPNWWVHTHSVTKVSCTSAGPSHTHTVPVAGLDACLDSVGLHTHTHTITLGTMTFAHTHNLASSSTGNADPTGNPNYPPGHTHTFTLTIVISGGHTHTTAGSVASNLCAGSGGAGCDHTHARPTSALSGNHPHTGSGVSGLGGEAVAAAQGGEALTFWG